MVAVDGNYVAWVKVHTLVMTRAILEFNTRAREQVGTLGTLTTWEALAGTGRIYCVGVAASLNARC